MLMPSRRPPSSSICATVKRLEVAVLVEDVVGRQQRLAKALVDAAVAQQRRGVEERPSVVGRIRLGQADQHRRLVGERRAPASASASQLRCDEAAAEQQIARQIADQRELRRDGEVGAARGLLRSRVRESAARCRRDRRPSG